MNFFIVFGLIRLVFSHKSIFFLFLVLEILFFGLITFLMFQMNFEIFILTLFLIVLSAILGLTIIIISIRSFHNDKSQTFLFYDISFISFQKKSLFLSSPFNAYLSNKFFLKRGKVFPFFKIFSLSFNS